MLKKTFDDIQQTVSYFWYAQVRECVICQKPGQENICEACRLKYFRPESNRCHSCGKLIGNRYLCRDCREGKGPKNLTRVTVLGHYTEGLKSLIHNVKFKGQPYHLTALKEYLASWVIRFLPPPDLIVPVPMHESRLAARGFNQSEVLASILSRQLLINYGDILFRNRDTIPQTSLGRSERLHNVKGAFSLKKEITLTDRIIWLVDDVVTTGNTLDECARVLKEKGASEVYAICLAAGMDDSGNKQEKLSTNKIMAEKIR